jgi:hypothetical protein
MPTSKQLEQPPKSAIDALAVERVAVDSSWFASILELRTAAYGRDGAGQRDAVDDYSLHFAARVGDEVVGALRVTCRRHGPLESEEHYPRWLLGEFAGRLCAASRMCVRPDWQGASLPIALTACAWRTVLPLGVRIDVSKARLELIPYYMRMGYLFLRDSIFQFDRWNVRCGLLAFPANAAHPSKFSALFTGVDEPCDLATSPHAGLFVASYHDYLSAVEAAA